MASGIDLPTAAKATGVPHATLRFWVQRYHWQTVGIGARGAKLYDAKIVRDACLAHPEFQRRIRQERDAA